MKQKTVHIISHSHWDREWYLPYEKHHAQLVGLMDRLLEELGHNPKFESFHLDGQTIILDDYLQVRPEKRDIIEHYVREGKLQIGPWYILQDEFLTSGEANIRNLQYGMKDSKSWGGMSEIGYFPDSFGNIGQAPQILKQAGITSAAFGRGVKPTGFNNMVSDSEAFESPFSEMIWRSPDGSSVLGVLFANWYCNGNEVPVEEGKARQYWDERLRAMEAYASTSQLLMMNGCDHQPIQLDLPKAIQTAEKLYPEIEFVHSSFNHYIKELQPELPKTLKTVDGELRSQQTDGWGTLVNTASSRLYLKQMNRTGEVLLEKVAEPLQTFAYMLGADYSHHFFEYAWKTLMQNHPHDSICGCSVDEVHREMVPRFEKSKHVAETLIENSLSFITNQIHTVDFEKYGDDALPFAVYNTTGKVRTGPISVVLDVKREYFASGVNKGNLKSFPLGDRSIIDGGGRKYDCEVEDLGIHFGYDLPDDKFRQPYMARRIQVSFQAEDVPALGFKTFACITDHEKNSVIDSTLVSGKDAMENDYLHVQIETNGSLAITDKMSGRVFNDLCIYEDTGDIGNEYMYKQPEHDCPLSTKQLDATVNLVTDTSFKASYEIIHDWEIPAAADELLDEEQRELVDFKYRKTKRSAEKIPCRIQTMVSLTKDGKGVEVETTFDNQARDHRLRALFPTGMETAIHAADSIFEVAERNIEPFSGWTNPDNSQHQQAFVNVSDEQAGLTIANHGLNEYEILRDGKQTIAITLLRSVRELGDWGYFPTPEAQCIGKHTVSFQIIPHQQEASKLQSFQLAYQFQVPWTVKQAGMQRGSLPTEHSFIKPVMDSDALAFSSLKVSEESGDTMARWFNLTENNEKLDLNVAKKLNRMYKSNILEEIEDSLYDSDPKRVKVTAGKYEIITVGFTHL
ncbi:alpha-mannosidase [Virgibacillus siamensis]|uniref:alpha-mannosidase n=1 Tax=Virgibacillus siamensis TaxID=480071 RepID=UPI0009865320|nr:alpha-mannosidase [Virgibacillus siamensis]